MLRNITELYEKFIFEWQLNLIVQYTIEGQLFMMKLSTDFTIITEAKHLPTSSYNWDLNTKQNTKMHVNDMVGNNS